MLPAGRGGGGVLLKGRPHRCPRDRAVLDYYPGMVTFDLPDAVAPSLLAQAQARAQGRAPPAKLGRRGDACGAVGDPPAPARPGDRRRGKERDEAAMQLAVIFKRFYCG